MVRSEGRRASGLAGSFGDYAVSVAVGAVPAAWIRLLPLAQIGWCLGYCQNVLRRSGRADISLVAHRDVVIINIGASAVIGIFAV